MKVLVACEESQTVCKAFRAKGHEAFSCDIIECSGGKPEWHLLGDAIVEIKNNDWDLIIAHPPCTYLTNAGVRHLHSIPSRNGKITKIHGQERFALMVESANFFKAIFNSDCEKICVENPIPHKYAKEIIGNYTQLIQPWQFGHGEIKATCLWLKGLPALKPTNIVEGREARIHKMPPSKDRAKLRSKTYEGIAKAMAEQWGNFFAPTSTNFNELK